MSVFRNEFEENVETIKDYKGRQNFEDTVEAAEGDTDQSEE